MGGFHYRVFEALPEFLRRRIYPLDFAVRDFVRSGLLENPSTVIDAGAGECRFREIFRGKSYFAVDAAVGDSSWDYSGLDLVADLKELPLRSRSADLVLNIQVLEHVDDPLRVIIELVRVLKPGGALYLTAPQGWHEHQQPHDFFRFTRFSLERLFARAGLEDIQIDPLGGYFHYLGHRLTYVPKILFSGPRGLFRLILFPLELLCLGVFCFVLPVVCSFLDPLDRSREFTLGYRARGRKPLQQKSPATNSRAWHQL